MFNKSLNSNSRVSGASAGNIVQPSITTTARRIPFTGTGRLRRPSARPRWTQRNASGRYTCPGTQRRPLAQSCCRVSLNIGFQSQKGWLKQRLLFWEFLTGYTATTLSKHTWIAIGSARIFSEGTRWIYQKTQTSSLDTYLWYVLKHFSAFNFAYVFQLSKTTRL